MENSNCTPECAWAEEALERYLDGELAPEEIDRLERHWLECSACGDEHELAEHVQTTLRALPRMRCPERVVRNVIAVDSMSPRRQWIRWTAAAGTLAAASIVVVIALGSSNAPPVNTPPPTPPVVDVQEDGREIAEQARVVLAYVGGVGRTTANTVQREALMPAVRELSNSLDSVLDQVLQEPTNANK